MKRLKKTLFAGFAVILLIGLAAAGWLYSEAVPLGTGYVAEYLKSN